MNDLGDKSVVFSLFCACVTFAILIGFFVFSSIETQTSSFETKVTKSAGIWAEKNNIKPTNISCIPGNVLEANCEINSGNEFIALICTKNSCVKRINKIIENNMTCESK